MERRYELSILFSKFNLNYPKQEHPWLTEMRASPVVAHCLLVRWNRNTDLRIRMGSGPGRGHHCEPYRDCVGGQFNPYMDHEECSERRSEWYDGRIERFPGSLARDVNHVSHNCSQFDRRY
jgi:hypothetical protein